MNEIIFLVTGAVFGGALSLFFFSKGKNLNKQRINQLEAEQLEKDKRNFIKFNDLEADLSSKDSELKKKKREIDVLENNAEELMSEITNLQKKNKALKKSNEELNLSIKEYEMIYNARKDELENLKNQLNK